MNLPIVITGSLAYDHVMTFPDQFENHIIPDKVRKLNVAFNIDGLITDIGGTAGNIAYNLALLNEYPIIHATAGIDFEDYRDHLIDWDLHLEGIKIIESEKTAQAFITTDLSDNQITAFYGGAMYRAHEHPLDLDQKSLVIISPNGIQAMVDHAKYCQDNKHPFIFDPGQALNALSGDQLVRSAQKSDALIFNDYEWELFKRKTGWSKEDALTYSKALIITRGKEGSQIHLPNKEIIDLGAVSDLQVVDPTGAGDAFRAGLMYGYNRNWNWRKSAQLGTILASYCVEVDGPQNHVTNRVKIADRYVETWNEEISL